MKISQDPLMPSNIIQLCLNDKTYSHTHRQIDAPINQHTFTKKTTCRFQIKFTIEYYLQMYKTLQLFTNAFTINTNTSSVSGFSRDGSP